MPSNPTPIIEDNPQVEVAAASHPAHTPHARKPSSQSALGLSETSSLDQARIHNCTNYGATNQAEAYIPPLGPLHAMPLGHQESAPFWGPSAPYLNPFQMWAHYNMIYTTLPFPGPSDALSDPPYKSRVPYQGIQRRTAPV